MMSCSKCPVALVSAGVGVTPMVSMLHALAAEGGERPVWFVHGVRDGGHHPLAREVRELATRHTGIRVHFVYSRPRLEDETGINFDSEGRVDGALLASLIEDVNAHYFLCQRPGLRERSSDQHDVAPQALREVDKARIVGGSDRG